MRVMKVSSSVLVSFFTVIVFVSSVFLVGITSSIGEYDPWRDIDDNGVIDMKDIGKVVAVFGTSGTPINKTALLLELQTRLDALNATVMALEEQIFGMQGCEVRVGTQTGTGGFRVSFAPPFSDYITPKVFAMAVLTLDDPGPSNLLKGMCPYPAVHNVNNTGFDVLLEDQVDGASMPTATVDIYYIAIGTESTGTLVVTGNIPYDANGVYDTIIGLSQDVSGLIPPGFTLVAAVATGYKAHQITGARQDEPPLILEPKVSGTVFQTRVWDASGDEYGGANWAGMRAHIDYTLFLTT